MKLEAGGLEDLPFPLQTNSLEVPYLSCCVTPDCSMGGRA